jgi:hypothetical protein
MGPLLEKGLCRSDDSRPLAGPQGFAGAGQVAAGLHFYQRQDAAAAGDQIDLAGAAAEITRQEAVALEAQPASGQALTAPPALPGAPPARGGHSSLRAAAASPPDFVSARARR